LIVARGGYVKSKPTTLIQKEILRLTVLDLVRISILGVITVTGVTYRVVGLSQQLLQVIGNVPQPRNDLPLKMLGYTIATCERCV
jgi:hypothetical protein